MDPRVINLERNRAMPDCPDCGQRCLICYRPCKRGILTHDLNCPTHNPAREVERQEPVPLHDR